MKVKKIKKINIGSFESFCWDPLLPDFNTNVNVFLGWNGSGKSIISRIFKSFQSWEIEEKINWATFSIEFDNGNQNESKCAGIEDFIRVFNEDYIRQVLSQSHLDYIIALWKVEVDLSWKEEIKKWLEEECKKINPNNEYDNIATSTANNIIKNIEGIGHLNKPLQSWSFNSYNKSSFALRIDYLSQQIKSWADLEFFQRDEEEITKLRSDLKNISKKEEEFSYLSKWNNWIIQDKKEERIGLERINECFNFIPTFEKSSRIDEYEDSSNEVQWIRQGFQIHHIDDKEELLENCLFCSSKINNNDELLKHFSEDYRALMSKLEDLKKISDIALKDIDNCISFFEDEQIILKDFFENIKLRLKEKNDNPWNVYWDLTFEDIFSEYSIQDNDMKEIAWELETHYVAVEYENYISKKESFEKEINIKKELNRKLSQIKKEISELQTKAKNVHIPKKKINDLLQIVFPYRKILLADAKSGIGYQITRNEQPCNLIDLSEGERNFLALAYFLISLNTEDAEKSFSKEGIVVIDDPISSLDSDSLFHIFSVLLGEIKTKDRRQYILLTHNLDFFWHLLKHFKKDKDEKLNNFYQIKSGINGSIITQLDKRLMNYNSDYRYAIQKLYELKDSTDLDDQIFGANLLRRALETFTFFKYGFWNLRWKTDQIYDQYIYKKIKSMEGAPDHEKEQKKVELLGEKETLYRFVNYWSHQFLGIDNIDISALQYSSEAINNFFGLIKKVDSQHYKSFKLSD